MIKCRSLCIGATQINITVKDGGNKLLQIQDNGSGVQVSMSAICRHPATHKDE